MKRVLCLLIAVLMLMSVGVMSVGAETIEGDAKQEIEQKLSDYWVDYGEGYGEVLLGEVFEEDGVIFFCGFPRLASVDPWERFTIIGDWFIARRSYVREESGFYVIVDDVVYLLEDAYAQGVITDLSPLRNFGIITEDVLIHGPSVYMIFDIDEDFKVTIKDVTAFQKHLAGMEITMPHLKHLSCDMDGDYTLTIRDATAIQKKLAGIAE